MITNTIKHGYKSDEGDRDSSRDWYYESDDFWEMPESPARCGPGQGLDASREACG